MYEVIVGVDFGSSGTRYAYSFNNPKKIEFGKFPFHNYEFKTPTQIILDSNLQNVLAFGKKCDSYPLGENDLYFKRIKMNLYNNKEYIKPENNFKSFHLIDIITKVFEYVKEEAIKTLKNNQPKITEDKIKWVVTVPSIWSLLEKSIMITACEKAGLFNQNTDIANFLALEPEAVFLYCSKDNTIDHSFLSPGKSYIVCNFGGETGDITTHHISEEGKITEKCASKGGPYGSDEIDNEFFNEIFGGIFGIKDFNSLLVKFVELKDKKELDWKKEDLYNEWKKLEKEIKDIKKITPDQKDQSFKIN